MKNGYCRSSGKKYAKMVLFGLKTHFEKIFLGYFYPPTLPMQKNRVKIVPKQVFTRGGFKSPPPYSMSIPEAPSCRVNYPSFQNMKSGEINTYMYFSSLFLQNVRIFQKALQFIKCLSIKYWFTGVNTKIND